MPELAKRPSAMPAAMPTHSRSLRPDRLAAMWVDYPDPMDEPWRQRFRAATVSWTRPAAGDRRRAVAMSNRSGKPQLYAWDVDTDRLRQLTDRPAGTGMGTISGDGRHVLYVDDRAGDELGHWVRVPFEGGPAEDLTADLPDFASYDLQVRPGASEVLFTAASAAGFETWLVAPDAPAGPRRVRLRGTQAMTESAGLSRDGTLAYVLSNERTGQPRFALLVLDAATGEQTAELWDGADATIANVVVSPVQGDARLAATSDRSGEVRPLLWDPSSGRREDLSLPGLAGEVVPWDWSPDGRQLLLCQTVDAVQRLYLYDLAARTARRLMHPSGTYGYWGGTGVWFGAGEEIVAQWQDATEPRQVVALDRHDGRRTRTLLAAEAVPPGRPWRSVSFDTEDGQTIQAWLATPDGDGPFPAIVETHGGPESVTTDQFMPGAQAWLDQGFCYLSVNYRGSTTFGRAFKEAIWGHIGEAEVRDVVAGRAYLVGHGLARPDAVFLTGWSYGGYITLHALGVAPGLWAGGMAGVAVADWVSEYEDENEVLRAYDRALFGGSPADLPTSYERASPLTYAAAVDAPVLIIQGRNDTRCPARQVELYEARLRQLGKPVEVIWFDAGHMGGDTERDIAHAEAMHSFAQRVLATRT